MRIKYGVTEDLDRTQAVKNIGRLDKMDLVQIIDGIPDQVVIKYVKIYIKKNVDQTKDQIFLQQIDSLWKKITQKKQSKILLFLGFMSIILRKVL